MRSLPQRSPLHIQAIIALSSLCMFLLGAVLTAGVQAASTIAPVPAPGERLISLHDNGRERGILTKATTLRQALKNANIPVDPNDLIEPSLDEVLVAKNYEVNIYRARPVTIIDGAIRTKIMSAYQTSEQIAEHAGMTLQDEDTTKMNANTNIVSEGAGVQLSIDRATPFNLVLYGTKKIAYTQATTIGEMLKQKNITLGVDDTLSVAASAAIQPGMTVELWRNGKQTANEDQDIAFGVEKIHDADREVGYKEVKTPGEKGKKTVTFEIEMKNGQEVGRKEIQSVVTKEPKKQVEVVGTKMTNTFSGSFAEALARLRSCEGSYTTNTGNGYYGAYQYDRATWANYMGYAVASDAPPAVQDQKAWETYQRRGWQPWPSCSRSQGLQDIYR